MLPAQHTPTIPGAPPSLACSQVLLRQCRQQYESVSLLQDLFRAITCFLFDMTDMGWHQLDPMRGVTDPEKQPGFVGDQPPGCVLLPDHTRACFVRADEGSDMLDKVSPPTRSWMLCRSTRMQRCARSLPGGAMVDGRF